MDGRGWLEAGLDVVERRVGRLMTDSLYQFGIVANFLNGDFFAEVPTRNGQETLVISGLLRASCISL